MSKAMFTNDGDLIYTPEKYPFEFPEGSGFVVQTKLFTYDGGIIESGFLAKDGKETYNTSTAMIFDDMHSAAKAAAKYAQFPRLSDDRNCYPRVLKIRMSCIVEGVAFESTVREIEGGAKLEGVA